VRRGPHGRLPAAGAAHPGLTHAQIPAARRGLCRWRWHCKVPSDKGSPLSMRLPMLQPQLASL
jgi:hypothetical protein